MHNEPISLVERLRLKSNILVKDLKPYFIASSLEVMTATRRPVEAGILFKRIQGQRVHWSGHSPGISLGVLRLEVLVRRSWHSQGVAV